MSACTLICPQIEYSLVSKWIDANNYKITNRYPIKSDDWSKIIVQYENGHLEINSLVRVKPGDEFSRILLGLSNCFGNHKHKNKKNLLHTIANVKWLLGIFVDNPTEKEDILIGGLSMAM
jgi:hypothetical protein